ncbi:HDIG domain-containing protein [Spirochaetia bacterium]|nr:HDIG domain-containing protein [Spirochaetia bacterium]
MGNRKDYSKDIHPLLRDIAGVFIRGGKKVYLVGGAVRDLLRGKKPQDWDLATDARPEEVISFFSRVIPTGIKHGTVTVLFKGHSFEVTTFRTESDYRDGRRPEKVSYAAAIEEDLSRRDFTMNAAALSLPEGILCDPFDGEGDIKRRLIRCVGNPAERFAEDGLRPMRALRFASQLRFDLDARLLEAIPAALSVTAMVAPERLREELDKIIASEKPSTAFRLMEKTGLLKLLLPELAACRNIEQKGYHHFDVLDHSLLAGDFAAAKNFPPTVRLAALFHDLGKPGTLRLADDGIRTFYQHEQLSAALTEKILRRLRYPNTVIDAVVHLTAEHMFHYTDEWTDAAVRRFVIRVGEENLDDLYDLRLCDAYGMAGIEPRGDILLPLRRRVEKVLAAGRALSLKDLEVSGSDLAGIGIVPGRIMGIILKELLDTVISDPPCNTREKLLEIAGNLWERYKG